MDDATLTPEREGVILAQVVMKRLKRSPLTVIAALYGGSDITEEIAFKAAVAAVAAEVSTLYDVLRPDNETAAEAREFAIRWEAEFLPVLMKMMKP